jgi:hypothetical protein
MPTAISLTGSEVEMMLSSAGLEFLDARCSLCGRSTYTVAYGNAACCRGNRQHMPT